MITDADLYERARATLNPRQLGDQSNAGGVASALVTTAGNVFTGVCIETPCGMGFCAEHNAIGSMITAGESQIQSIVAVHRSGAIFSPCGRCREFIAQIDSRNSETRVLLSGEQVLTIRELLPFQWVRASAGGSQ